jgi:hypothetical protein
VFLGSEFSYECPTCRSVHVFAENLFPDFPDNFRSHGCGERPWSVSRYVGTLNRDGTWTATLPGMRDTAADRLTCARTRRAAAALVRTMTDTTERLAVLKRPDRGVAGRPRLFVANAASNDHFQDCLRGVVRMKERLVSRDADGGTLLLVGPAMELFFREADARLAGIDDVWFVPGWTSAMDWLYLARRPDDVAAAAVLAATITEQLDRLEGRAQAVSKRPGPTSHGSMLIRDLLATDPGFQLRDTRGERIDAPHVAVLVHSDGRHRAGFHTARQLREACHAIAAKGLRPVVVACSPSEAAACAGLVEERVLVLRTIEQQAAFYSRWCRAVVGTNCSGCNLPCLYGLPVFALAKGRRFPDDFYCMGRMLSPYDCRYLFNGDLTKPDSVVEIGIDPEAETGVSLCAAAFYAWLDRVAVTRQ